MRTADALFAAAVLGALAAVIAWGEVNRARARRRAERRAARQRERIRREVERNMHQRLTNAPRWERQR